MRQTSIYQKELEAVVREEEKKKRTAHRGGSFSLREALQDKIPEKVFIGLEEAFRGAFELIFREGTFVIEYTYDRKMREQNRRIRQYVLDVKGTHTDVQQYCHASVTRNVLNAAVTTVEGVGLGMLGVGIPDIVLFLGILLRGIYETALDYGYDYHTSDEKYFILKMMETALLRGDAWENGHAELDRMITEHTVDRMTIRDMNLQIRKTSSAFATDMIVLKFIQGLPVIGVAGGIGNPVYYQKVLNYVQLMYKKRYLIDRMAITQSI